MYSRTIFDSEGFFVARLSKRQRTSSAGARYKVGNRPSAAQS